MSMTEERRAQIKKLPQLIQILIDWDGDVCKVYFRNGTSRTGYIGVNYDYTLLTTDVEGDDETWWDINEVVGVHYVGEDS